MLAIYKRELKSYFQSMIGYVFIAFFLLIIGFVFSYINIQQGTPFIGYTLQYAYVTVVFMILVPIITMKILADERRLKTDQLLFTAPITVTKIVMGKFLAVVTVFCIPMVVVAFYPFFLTVFGDVPLPSSYVAVLGFFLMGLAYLSIGLFVSSLTESQIISAVGTFGILLISFTMSSLTKIISSAAIASFIALLAITAVLVLVYYMMTKDKKYTVILFVIAEGVISIIYAMKSSWFESLIQKIMMVLSLNDHFEKFVGGIFDLTAVVYYISVIGFFLFLTVQSIQKRRWS